MIGYEEVEKRMLEKGCKPEGKTITIWKKVYYTVWPAGTNIVVEFIKALKGLPYGDNGMKLDKSADCSQFAINLMWYFFGIDYLGSYTQSIYNAGKKHGKRISLAEAKPLTIVLYKFNNRNPNATHAAIVTDAVHIWHTRSKSRPLMEDNIMYGFDDITMVLDLLTDEQRASVTVKGSVATAQIPKYKYTGSGLRIRARASLAAKQTGFIVKYDTVDKFGVDGKWWHVRLGSVNGWCKPNTKYFKRV